MSVRDLAEYRCKLQRCGAVWIEGEDGTFVADRVCFNSPQGKPMLQADVDRLIELDVMEKLER